MSKLVMNDDGTITVPLIPNGSGARSVTLPEPSMRQLARMHDFAIEADKALPQLTALSEKPTAEQAQHFTDSVRERSALTYSEESPHGLALLSIIVLLTDEQYTPDDVPGWVCNPRTLNQILTHFQSPLPGADTGA